VKSIGVRDLQKKVKECVDEAQVDRIVITRRGKPAAVLIGVEDKSWDTVISQSDPAFWKLIRTRRAQPTVSIFEMRKRLGIRGKGKPDR
jgi:prevent-host-death family protein